ncbi:MAG: UDP-N-acetylglucosamine--N-acetylmuramyl-(pentapeptide) pyrophosphoryl-undecaprenol N-acetylglucosamine transferase [Candidatus Planktophila sp.]|nr:UDP-N-acetylglucosamine--N-acetylmuramyl-(pentapeptide) pyrophosphoryl-undecaprenol N-acetylglucosamine transferase [Candidatus Planktophila sp.]MBP7903250.1 UDP-N-acetylglucosamine--N-acetylmuramyl-(pentapeptide) pyrophosphoryl-undecaprenol N-acetylglucosamine transferase [Candidatus Planktophila sp.]
MKILFAGGGTAGHVEPALAVARAWQSAHPEDEISFLGTAQGLENTLIPAAGFTLHHIPKVAIARTLSPSLLKVPFQLIAAISATRSILKDVDCAVGFGGYVSGPLYLAAFLTRTPFVIHEQNAHPGWANRLGARLTKSVALSFPVANREFSGAELTGLPLRADVMSALSTVSSNWETARTAAKSAIASRYGLEPEQPLIFIFGGSQGSQAINQVISDAREFLNSHGVSILHGVGKNNAIPEPSTSYRALPYIDDMAQCYLAADLLISRSGAVTCAEAQALARYSLFIPLPIGNGEQALNAAALVNAGRAEVIKQSDFTPDWLATHLTSLLQKSSDRPVAGDASGAQAADKIVTMIERAAGK